MTEQSAHVCLRDETYLRSRCGCVCKARCFCATGAGVFGKNLSADGEKRGSGGETDGLAEDGEDMDKII